MLVDVAIPSFHKPESLIYTLLTLHRHCAGEIGTIWISDDCSGPAVTQLYREKSLLDRLSPWQVVVHEKPRSTGFAHTNVTGRMAQGLFRPGLGWENRARRIRGLLAQGLTSKDDIRYQHGMSNSTADYMLVLHDDVEITANVVSFLRDRLEADPHLAIVGHLGQCWRCGFQGHCTPARIVKGERPGPHWPLTPRLSPTSVLKRDRACRINEWCCMLRMQAIRALNAEEVFFGNKEDGGDTGAYWFDKVQAKGWGFDDPFLRTGTDIWFRHGWQGHPGHAVWVGEHEGKVAYDAASIRKRLTEEFAFTPENGWPDPACLRQAFRQASKERCG